MQDGGELAIVSVVQTRLTRLERATRAGGGIAVVTSPDDARVIRGRGVRTVVWRRRLPPSLGGRLAERIGSDQFASHVDASPEDLDVLARLTAFVPRGPEADALAVDAVSLGRLLCKFTGARRICASLATVDDDKCRKFHADYKALRLVVTYVGPGTECVPEGGLHRESLGVPLEDMDEANRLIVPDENVVLHAAAGDVVILKGEAFPGNAGYGAVHRSPPIAARGLRRLVLKIDTDDVVDPALAPS